VHGLCTLGLGLQLILQWLTGILVLICCFVEKKKFSVDISSKLGSSFSLVPFVIVVVSILLTFVVHIMWLLCTLNIYSLFCSWLFFNFFLFGVLLFLSMTNPLLFTGSLHHLGYDCYLTPCAAVFLSHSSH